MYRKRINPDRVGRLKRKLSDLMNGVFPYEAEARQQLRDYQVWKSYPMEEQAKCRALWDAYYKEVRDNGKSLSKAKKPVCIDPIVMENGWWILCHQALENGIKNLQGGDEYDLAKDVFT